MKIHPDISKSALLIFVVALFLVPDVSHGISNPEYVRDYFDHDDEPLAAGQLDMIDNAHTRKAIRWIREGRYRDAIADLHFVLIRWPNHPKALMILMSVSSLSGSPMLPRAYFEKALSLYPQHAITHAQYGKFLVEVGETDAGITKLKYAVEKDPSLTAGYVWLAEAYAKKGDRVRAGEAAKRAKELGYRGDLSEELGPSASRP